jgi:hypothetical protein
MRRGRAKYSSKTGRTAPALLVRSKERSDEVLQLLRSALAADPFEQGNQPQMTIHTDRKPAAFEKIEKAGERRRAATR